MSSQFTRDHMKISVAKILQTLGWHSINTTPLELLTDILHNYMFQLSKLSNEYANEFGCIEPNLDHLGLAFREMGISLPELEEYVKYVNFGAISSSVSKYPVSKEDQLNFLKPGSKEVVTRPVHIHEHLPPMNPILEGATVDKEATPPEAVKVEESLPDNQPVFKKPPDVPPAEFKKLKRDEEGSRPTREISSVMMTTSGFLSPAREGKLPEAKTPIPPPTEPPPPPPAPPLVNPPSLEQPKEIVPARKPPRPIKRIEKRKDRVGKELFKINPEDKIRKNQKETAKMRHLKMMKANHPFLHNLPQGLNIVKLPPMPHNMKINPTKFNNKALQAARLKTEKLNTTITPLPIKPTPVINSTDINIPQINEVDKLLTAPDRKKANILKKISNTKDKIDEKLEVKKEDVKEDPSSPPNLIIDEPEDMIPKLAQLRGDITIEPINPPPFNETNIKPEPLYFNDSPPCTPSTPKTPEMISTPAPVAVKEKKKRKPKVRKIPKPDTQTIPYGSFNEIQVLAERPKTPKAEVEISAHHSPIPAPQTPDFPFGNINPYHLNATRPNLQFLANFGGPGLIPPPLGNPLNPLSNPLFPTHFPLLNLPDFGQHPYLPQNLPPIPNPLTNFLPKLEDIPSSSLVPEPICLPPPRTPEPVTSTTFKPEKIEKKSKEHKKEKKDKLKKKAKKEKLKAKAEKKEEKKRIKKKEKRDKRREKEVKEESSSSVLKLTLKLKSPSPRPVTPDTTTKKLNIKAVVKKEPEPIEEADSEVSSLAKISALVTGPPKPKSIAPPVVLAFNANYPNPYEIMKKTHKPEYKPIPKLKVEIKKEPIFELPPAPPSKYVDAEGNEVWICPGCSRQDDGSPMIGCDGCDAWYHWVCVGIQVPPDENENWYCRHCLLKKDEDLQSDKKKKRKRKEKKEQQ